MSFEILISWAIEKWSEVLLYVIWNPRKQQNQSVDSFTGHPVVGAFSVKSSRRFVASSNFQDFPNQKYYGAPTKIPHLLERVVVNIFRLIPLLGLSQAAGAPRPITGLTLLDFPVPPDAIAI